MTTIADIRSRLSTALASELGTYQYGSQTPEPALIIDNGSYPAGLQEPKKSGLECVIEPEIASPGYGSRLGGDFVCAHQSRITLKQWDATDTTMTARSLILQEFSNLFDSPPVRVPRVSELGAPEQLIFTFTLPSSS